MLIKRVANSWIILCDSLTHDPIVIQIKETAAAAALIDLQFE